MQTSTTMRASRSSVAPRGVRPNVTVRATVQQQLASAAVATVLLAASPALASDPAPAPPQPPAEPSTISFTRVTPDVAQKFKQMEENRAWKCKGVSMFDCDGERAEADQQRFEEFARMMRGEAGKDE